jgi:DNA-binding beta-propeller fold protein YncE
LALTFRRCIVVAGLALATFAGAPARPPSAPFAIGTIPAADWPYFPGSALRVAVDGFNGPYGTAVLGAGSVQGGAYRIQNDAAPGSLVLVAGNQHGIAERTLRVAAPPAADRALIAVASYDDGVAFHDAATFAPIGLLGADAAISDVAIDATGRLAAIDTQGSTMTLATLAPWSVSRVRGVVAGDELAIDASTGAIFANDRDVDGSGAVTRVTGANVARVPTGNTAEGLAIDERRQIVYVANTNDGSVAAVDARTMNVLHRFQAVDRAFSLALSRDGSRLYAVSNQSASSPFARPGSVVAIAMNGARPRVVARSADLTFPLGIALDDASNTLFVTDEELDVVDVLDARSLHPKRAPLATCSTPWKPLFDPVERRLYVPCARANAVDVFDARTLRRVAGAPFATAGYPLSVAVWHPRR